MASIQLTSEKVREMLRYLDQLSARSVHRSTVGTNSNNSSGDYLDHADNCFLCFDIIGGAKECAYSEGIGAGGAQNLYDCSFGGIGSIDVYNSMGFSAHNKVIAQLYGRECHDCSYNQYCFSSHDLFGCIGLRHGEYMILNKKYSKEDYFNLKSLIINHMRKTGEWGNFFPAQYSPYAYNETIAQDFFPLTKEEVIKRHWKWKDENRLHAARQETKIIRSCQECKKSFQMIDQELLFYKKFNLPNPDRCPECRFQRRFQLRNPRKLYSRACAKCAMPIQTTYSTERPEIVYCENCYLKEVY